MMNWRMWLAWAEQRDSALLFLAFLLVAATPIAFAPFAAKRLYAAGRGLRFKLVRYTSFVLLAIAVDGACGMMANVDPVTCVGGRAIYSPWFIAWFCAGKTALFASVANLCWYVLNPHNGVTERQ